MLSARVRARARIQMNSAPDTTSSAPPMTDRITDTANGWMDGSA